MVALAENVSRKHVIRQHGRRCHEYFMRHDEILIQQRPVNLILIGVAEQRVVPQGKERLDGIGIGILHRAENQRGVRHLAAHHDICVGIAPGLLSGIAEHVRHAIGVGGMLVIPELLRFLFSREHFVQAKLGFRDIRRIETAQALTPGCVQVSRHGPKNRVQPNRRGRRNLLIRNRRPGNHRRIRACVHPSGFGDQLPVDTGDRLDSLERVLVHPRPEFLEAHAPIPNEVLVVEPFIKDDLQPPKAHGCVRSRPKAKVQIGDFGLA